MIWVVIGVSVGTDEKSLKGKGRGPRVRMEVWGWGG